MTNETNQFQEKQRIDWGSIRQQLEAAERMLSQSAERTPEENQATLRKRARQLAQETRQEDAAGDLIDIVVFHLASEVYGVESDFVREVYPLKEFTPLPGTPSFVLGIVNVRGQILSIIDLKKFFNLPGKGLGQLNKLIILRDERLEFGILADEILGSRSIPVESIQPAPPTVSGIGAEYLRGITTDSIILLDAAKILRDENIIVDQTNY